MIFDKELEMTTGVAVDLGDPGQKSDGSFGRLGPGLPIMLAVNGMAPGNLVITHGDDDTNPEALLTVAIEAASEQVPLPSTLKRWITATFASGTVDVILGTAQTNQ